MDSSRDNYGNFNNNNNNNNDNNNNNKKPDKSNVYKRKQVDSLFVEYEKLFLFREIDQGQESISAEMMKESRLNHIKERIDFYLNRGVDIDYRDKYGDDIFLKVEITFASFKTGRL
jgi:hypothetical protein